MAGREKRKFDTVILGAGITGLAAGVSSGIPIFEARDIPGGICASYYLRPHGKERLNQIPPDGEAYRFEIGGGHWIFGGDPVVLHFIERFMPVKRYERRSSVYFHDKKTYVPYPLQNNLRFIDRETADKALEELLEPKRSVRTMKEWLKENFGPTLCNLFFYPFHESYTAGFYDRIAPQDGYKTPVNLTLAIQGSRGEAPSVGYNVTFLYPRDGLNALSRHMASQCQIHYGHRLMRLDVKQKMLYFENGAETEYKTLLSTIPLNEMMKICDLKADSGPDPCTSVLVLNIGAVREENCPNDHWLYNFNTKAGFHRVGFYSNVDTSFLPQSSRSRNDRVSVYVERAFAQDRKPSHEETENYSRAVVEELQEWGFIGDCEAADPTWIDVAYTWAWPESRWRAAALKILQTHGIYQIGRYGRWTFQGIADSIRDGFYSGPSFKTPA